MRRVRPGDEPESSRKSIPGNNKLGATTGSFSKEIDNSKRIWFKDSFHKALKTAYQACYESMKDPSGEGRERVFAEERNQGHEGLFRVVPKSFAAFFCLQILLEVWRQPGSPPRDPRLPPVEKAPSG